MSKQTDLTDQADVYSESPQTEAGSPSSSVAMCRLKLSVECSPLALSRVFGLLGTISMVPALSRTTMTDNEIIDVFIEFVDADAHKLDLLCRKLSQLTEIVDFRTTATYPIT